MLILHYVIIVPSNYITWWQFNMLCLMHLLYTCIIILTWLSSDSWRNHPRRWAYRQLWLVILFINSGVFFQLILSPFPADVFTRRVLSCIWLRCEMRARSSAKSRSLSCVRSDHCIPMFLSDVLVLMILSTIERKRNSDNRHAYRTPYKLSNILSAWANLDVMPW